MRGVILENPLALFVFLEVVAEIFIRCTVAPHDVIKVFYFLIIVSFVSIDVLNIHLAVCKVDAALIGVVDTAHIEH